MRVSDKYLKCVIFIGFENKKSEVKFIGTGFFISDNSEIEYLVTAKHVIGSIKENSKDGKVLLRVNLKDGSAKTIFTHSSEWLTSEKDSFIDVAIFPWISKLYSEVDYLLLDVFSLITDTMFKKPSIGIGDDVFMTGLFVSHYGTKKNIPVIRLGNISMMPSEPIGTEKYGDIEAYLIESRSTGGLSGSPVFVREPFPVNPPNLLGLIHGHFDSKEENGIADAVVMDVSGEQINMGMAIVIPSSKIVDIINSNTKLIQIRKELRALKD